MPRRAARWCASVPATPTRPATPTTPSRSPAARSSRVILAATLTALALGGPTAAARDHASQERHFGPRTVDLGWVGDIAFGRHYGLPPGGARAVLSHMRSYLRQPDLMTGNLEGTLGEGGSSKCGGGSSNYCFAFQAPASYARDLRYSGFDVMNLANNHTNDFGSYGIGQTLGALDHARLRHSGLRGGMAIRRAHGIKVAFLGFAPYPWANDLRDVAGAERLVRRARRHADLVVVMMHAGAEGADKGHTPHGTEYYLGENRGDSRRFAHSVVAAGADLVVGSGPHVLRGIECYRRRVIAYSLGNFAGYNTLRTGGYLSLSGVLRVRLAKDGTLRHGRLLPATFDSPGTPHRGGGSVSHVRRLSREDFGSRACRISRHGLIAMP